MTDLTAYLDASRDSGDSNVASLAGFISDAERWPAFDAEWKQTLDDFDLPSFHMTDFEAGYGHFKGWHREDNRRIPLLTSLLGVIHRNTVGSVAMAVSQSMYSRVVPKEVNDAVGRNPYFFLFLNLVLDTEALMDNAAKFGTGIPYDWRMNYILARGDPGAGQVVKIWMSPKAPAVATRITSRVASVSIAPDNGTLPALQAADILAFEGRKQVGLQLGQHERKSRLSLAALEKSSRPRAWHFYQSDLHLSANADTISRVLSGDPLSGLLTRDSVLGVGT